MPIVKTVNLVAEALGVSIHTVRSWRLQGCPGEPGKFDVVAIRDWRKARDAKRQPPTREEIVKQLADYIAADEPVPADLTVKLDRRFGQHHTIAMFAEARRLVAAADLQGTSEGDAAGDSPDASHDSRSHQM